MTAAAKLARSHVETGYVGRNLRVRLELARIDVVALLRDLAAEEARADHLLGAIVEICNGKVTGPAILAHAKAQRPTTDKGTTP